MGEVTIHIWTLILGAVAGFAAVAAAKNNLVMGAVIGGVTAVILTIARGFFQAMLRRLHHTQPDAFAFTPANLEWAKGQITKYPEGRQAIVISPLLWRVQEQERCLAQSAFELVAEMFGRAVMRAPGCRPAAKFRKALR